MKKLEDIPKTKIFRVPDGYFDNLPSIIQSRITETKNASQQRISFITVLKYATVPIIILAVVCFWLTNSYNTSNTDSILATIQTKDLIAYLNDSELTTDDLIENIDFDSNDLNEIEEKVYHLNLTDSDLEDAVEGLDLKTF